MKKSIFIIFALLASLALACNFSFSTANISDAKMAKDPDGQQPTTVFNPDEKFYAVMELNNASDDTAVKAVWTAVEVEGTEPNLVLDEASLTSGDGTLQFDLTSDNPWPAGKYKVDLYLNDELAQTLEFEVEGEPVAQEPTPTEEPTASPTPEPTNTPEPTEEPTEEATEEPTEEAAEEATEEAANSTGDSLATTSEEATDEPSAEATEEYEPLPFQAEPYTHPSGAFTFAAPEGWEVISEEPTTGSIGAGNSVVGAVFVDGERVYSEEEMQAYINAFIDSFVGIFGDDYQILSQEPQPDDSIYVDLYYTGSDGSEGYMDFFFEQRETVVFVFYFVTDSYEELVPTWDEIIASYRVDPEAALAALQAAEPTVAPTVAPPPPTPTPVPVNPFAPQAGRSRLYVFNEYNQELTFTINGKENKIPITGIDNPIPLDLDPGRYTYTVSVPGGAANGEVTMAANQSWAVGVRGDGAVYNPFQVYP